MADPDARRTASETPPVISDMQAVVSPEDLERAKLAAQRDGSALLNVMLHAKAEERDG